MTVLPAVAGAMALALLASSCTRDGDDLTPPGLWAWGGNGDGQLGDGTTTDSPVPVRVVGPGGTGYLTGVTVVACGNWYTAVVRDDGTAWTWGYGGFGSLGHIATQTPAQVVGPGGSGYLTGVASVAAGTTHTVALMADGTVWAWGANDNGALGDGTTTDSPVPVQVVGPGGTGYLAGVAAVACQGGSTVALKDDGTVWAWGYNGNGRLGDGTTTDSPTPVQVVGPGGSGYLTDAAAVAAGGYFTVASRDDGTAWAWGRNDYGQLGDGTTTDSPVPVQVVGTGGIGYLTSVTAVAATSETGYSHAVALKDDGSVWAWGCNGYGQLGDGTTTGSSTPVQVVGPGGSGDITGVTSVAAGGHFTVALRDDGTVWAWGGGMLGNGTTTGSTTPVCVAGPGGSGHLNGITAIAADLNHAVALRP
jgi:alpha-tubulin suppressor-like RCC1 family protein